MTRRDQTLKTLSLEEINQIKNVTDFARNSDYNQLDIQATLKYMKSLYVDQMTRHLDIQQAVLCDCAAGYGWLGLSFLLCGGRKSIFVEPVTMKLNAIRKFAEILNLSDKCEFRQEYLQDIPHDDNSIDIFATVETLEHVGRENVDACMRNINRLTSKMIILTTPNRLFPIVSHDSVVPFTHWLPIKWRDYYLCLWGKEYQGHNHFLTPFDLKIFKKRFKQISKVLTFQEFNEWREHYPFYSPYGKGRWKEKPHPALFLLLWLTSRIFGRNAYKVNPNLASVWLYKAETLKSDSQVDNI